MLIRRFLGAITLCVMSLSAFAGSTIVLPDQAELLVIDGKDAKEQKFSTREGIQLADGKHQVVFQFKGLLKGNSERSMYTSDPYLVTFSLAGNQQHELVVNKDFRSIKDAEQFAKAPTNKLKLVDSNNNKVPYKLAVLKKKGMQFGRDLVEETRVFNLSSDPAALYSLTGGAMVTTASGSQLPVAQGVNKEIGVLAENNLKYWFMQADKETRARFLKWANQQ